MEASTRPDRWLAVLVGGALGTLARYEVTLAVPVEPGRFPWAIAVVNLVGCVVAGAVLAAMRARPAIPERVRLFVVVGVCGGLTTFSSWMVDDVLLLRDGAVGIAVLDVVVSLGGGLAAVGLAFWCTSAALRTPVVPPLDPREAD